MARYAAKKFIWHFAVCFLIWLIIDLLSPQGRLYAGWFSGFLGACYLLGGWFSYLKSKGTDFMGLLRRKRPPDVPYYLRGEKDRKPKLSLNGSRHSFDDDLAETAAEELSGIPRKRRQQLNAWSFLAVGLALLVLSAF